MTGSARTALITRPGDAHRERRSAFDVRHEATPELLRQTDVLSRGAHVAGPLGALRLGDAQTMMGTPHDGEATPLLRMDRGAAEQLRQPEAEALGVVLAGIAEQWCQQRIVEEALVEAPAEPLDRLSTTGEVEERRIRRVGTVRFELTTPRSQSACATRLRHVPLRVRSARGD